MTNIIRFETDTDPTYIKARKSLIKMFQPHVNDPEKQLPLIVDAMSLFVAGLAGNGFYDFVSKDNLHHHQQYDDISIEILTLGIKAYMDKNKLTKNPIINDANSGCSLPYYLNKVLKQLSVLNKKLKAYTKKKNK
jgi:hypothetical protein